MIGYMNGLALTILVGQLPKLFGFSVDADGFIAELKGFVTGVADGETVPAALAVGVVRARGDRRACSACCRRSRACSSRSCSRSSRRACSTSRQHGVKLVGTLPQGFPPFTLPGVGLSDLPLLFGGAVGIALVSLADTIATASAFADRTGQEVDGNQEMIGIGAANIAAGLFQGFPVSTSGSRTAVAEQAGAKTQVTGLVGAVGDHADARARPRPAAEPAAADARGGRDRRLALAGRHPRHDAALAAAPDGVRRLDRRVPRRRAARRAPRDRDRRGLSIADVFRRAWWPYQTVLGRVAGLPGYHDVRSYPEAERLPGLVIFRFDAPLFFANARTFREQVRRLAAAEPPPTWIVVAAEPITDVDTTAADMLEDLDEALNAQGVVARLRRDEGSGAAQDRPLRADADDRSGPLLPDARGRGRRLPS